MRLIKIGIRLIRLVKTAAFVNVDVEGMSHFSQTKHI